MTRPEVMQDSAKVMNAIRRIVQTLHQSSRHMERELGLSGAQVFVLRKLASSVGKALSLTQLAELTLTHVSSVSVVVKRLAERGMVERNPASDDRRRMDILPTEAGLRLLSMPVITAQERLIDALKRLPTSQQTLLAQLLERWIEEAGLLGEEAPMCFEPSEQPHPSHL